MRAVALSVALLLFSGYVWPVTVKQSTDLHSLLIVSVIGVVATILIWLLLPNSKLIGRLRIERMRLGRLVLLTIPVACLEVALGLVYWAYIGGPRLTAGALAAVPAVLFALWALAESGIRGVSEEAVFRGLLQPTLTKRYECYAGGLYIAISITTCVFLFAHLYGISDFRILPHIGFLSLCYGYLVAKSGHFASSAVLHTAHNIGAVTIVYAESALEFYDDLLSSIARLGSTGGFLLLALILTNLWAVKALAKKWVAARMAPSA